VAILPAVARSRSAQRDITLGGALLVTGGVVTLVAWIVGARLGAALTAGVVTCIAVGIVVLGLEARSRPGPAQKRARRPGEPPEGQVPQRARATRRKR
jgi:hypothetical protein